MSDYPNSVTLMWPVNGSNELHVTVEYLGEKENVKVRPVWIITAIEDYISAPGEVLTLGTEIFGEGEDRVWVALVDDSDLAPLQASVVQTLQEEFGIENASSYPQYRPHVTVAKYVEGSEPPEIPDVYTLGEMELWSGDSHFYRNNTHLL